MMKRIAAVIIGILMTTACPWFMAGCEFGSSSDSNPVIFPLPVSKYKFESCLGNSVQYPSDDLAPSSRGKSPMGTPAWGTYVPGEVLVKFKDGVSRTEALDLVSGNAVRADAARAASAWTGWLKVDLAGRGLPAALADLAAVSGVEYVQPNYVYRAAAVPNDPDYGQLWGLNNTGQTINDPEGAKVGTSGIDMGLEAAWEARTDCRATLIAVVDSGVNYLHQDLAANMWDGTGCPTGYDCSKHGYDFVDNDNDPMDLDGHGTHVAGTIGAAGDNGLGLAGVCWSANLMAVRVLNSAGQGTSESISAGMTFAAEAGAKVINMSLGGDGQDQMMFDAAKKIRDAGAILVVSAGNDSADNDSLFSHPGCFNFDNIINVAALGPDGGLADFSNHGAVSVDVAGPGVSIYSSHAGVTTEFALDDGTWQFSPGSMWGWGACEHEGALMDVLADPADFCGGGVYENNADHQAWTQLSDNFIDLGPFDSASLAVWVNLALDEGDFLRVGINSNGGNPFDPGGTIIFESDEGDTEGKFTDFAFTLDGCLSADCSIGMRLQTDGSGQNGGVAVLADSNMTITGLTLADDQYRYMEGTSMASPNVAGVVALLWSQYPQASYRDVILAVFDGTKPVASLAGKTCTGGLVNAANSLDLLAEWYNQPWITQPE
ncbi:MAG: S8 family serine peptidase [Pseudomonadota bacterium]